MSVNKRFSGKYSPYKGHPPIPKVGAYISNIADATNKKPIDFIIDTGATYTWIGSEFRKLLKLERQGPPHESLDIDGNTLKNDSTFIIIELPLLGYQNNFVKAIISNREGNNYLGRNFLNCINIFLLGKDLRYILHV